MCGCYIFLFFLCSSQDKPRNAKPPPTKQSSAKTTRSSVGNQSLKSQPHKQQANKNQKGRPEDVFSRLQKIYGNSEESQGVQRSLENQVKTVSFLIHCILQHSDYVAALLL